MHTRGQGCIYEIYQHSVKKEAHRDWIWISEGVCLNEKNRKNRKSLLHEVAFAGTFRSSTDHNAGSFPESNGSQNGLNCEV